MYRKTWFEIDLDAVIKNVRTIKRKTGKKFIAVLKANAYGCGDKEMANAVLDAGADMIAVSSTEEALILRQENISCPILILGATSKEDLPLLIENHITVTAYSLSWIEEMLQEEHDGLTVHLKVDTGMNRIGFKSIEELQSALSLLQENHIKVEGIFTHFACADSSREMTDRQFLKFTEAVQALSYPFEYIHCDNSDASLSYEEPFSNAVRVGISLYGISSVYEGLEPALSLYTKIFHVKTVQPNETIGYGATYTTSKEEIIATIPIGYADGFVRKNQGRKVYAEGTYAEVVGRVCMDQTMLKLPAYRPIGTTVEIFGPHIPLEKMAQELETIPYEIICLLNSRVTRTYIRDSKQICESNLRLSSIEL